MPTAALPLTDHIYTLRQGYPGSAQVLVVRANYVVVCYVTTDKDGKFPVTSPDHTLTLPTPVWNASEPQMIRRSTEEDLA